MAAAAARCVLMTEIYVGSMRPDPLHPFRHAPRQNHRASGPDAGRVPEFFGEGILVALFAVLGRMFRLRLSTSRNESGFWK